MTELQETIRAILATELELSLDQVLASSELQADLGVDSMAALQIGCEIEAAVGVKLHDEIVGVETVSDLVAFVERRWKSRAVR